MSLRHAWRRSKHAISVERHDERHQHARLLVMRNMLYAVLAVLAAGVLTLEFAPLPAEQTQTGYVLLPFALVAAAGIAAGVSERRYRSQSLEYRRAAALQTFVWWPIGALAYGLVQLLLGYSITMVLVGAITFLVVGIVMAAVRYRRASAALDRNPGDTP
ncbi:MAG: hypothetical protein ACRDQA_00220 [Nocardioidaceae bacterium]